jgi:rfaE bifunctional protein kinase chain/domain
VVQAWLERTLGQVSRARVAVFGDFALDAYWDLDPDRSELSVESGKPVTKVRHQRYGLGGAGNVAANLAALKISSVQAIGLIGEDLFGDHMLRRLLDLGIETGSLLRSQDDWQTPVFAKPHRDGEEQSRIDFGAFNELTQASFDRLQNELERAANNCEIVILNQQIFAGISPSPVIAWLNQLIQRFPKGRFLVDSRDRPHEYDGAILKINESEARRMQEDPKSSPEALVKSVHERAGAPVFITRGENGILAADANGVHVVPGVPVGSTTDPVGAGDTAVAAIAAALAGGVDVATAARFANLAAAVTVTKLQTTGTASHDEIRALAERSE